MQPGSAAAGGSDLPPYMAVPVSRIASAPADTRMLLDMAPAWTCTALNLPGVECVVIPARAADVHDALRGVEGVPASQVAQALEGSVLPALRKACRRLLRLSPEEKSNFDLDCVLLCLMEEKLGAIPLPIFYYQPCCANTACRAAARTGGGPLMKCSGCSGMALYCSRDCVADCQLKDRPLHKQHCKLAQLIPQEQMQGFLQAADMPHTR